MSAKGNGDHRWVMKQPKAIKAPKERQQRVVQRNDPQSPPSVVLEKVYPPRAVVLLQQKVAYKEPREHKEHIHWERTEPKHPHTHHQSAQQTAASEKDET